MFGADAVVDVAPVMPAEDFSFFAEEWPSAMMWLGSYNVTAGATWPLHSGKYVLDESVLHRGVAMHVGYATEFMSTGFDIQ
jgi:IAA-amino acid hydrolase